jgi:hypothetical protein
MSISAALVRELQRAGLEGEALSAALDRIEEAEAPTVNARQARNRRYYEKRKAEQERLKATEQDVSDAFKTPEKKVSPDPFKETTPLKNSPSGNPIPKPAKRSARDELRAVLDETRADAVLEHRQRIRKPLTAYAARLLAGKFAQVPDPNGAADAMVANGWQGFETRYLENRNDTKGGAAAPTSTLPKWQGPDGGRRQVPEDPRRPDAGVLRERGKVHRADEGERERPLPRDNAGQPGVDGLAGLFPPPRRLRAGDDADGRGGAGLELHGSGQTAGVVRPAVRPDASASSPLGYPASAPGPNTRGAPASHGDGRSVQGRDGPLHQFDAEPEAAASGANPPRALH